MQLTINDKTYNVKFGVKFVRTLDSVFATEREGLKFGFSLNTKITELMTGNIAALADILYYGTVTESPRPSMAKIEEFVEEHEDLEGLFDEVIKELSESNAGKSMMAGMEANLEK